MNDKLGWTLAAVLLVICAAFSFFLIHRAADQARVPVFMPLVVDQGAPPPEADTSPGPDAPPPNLENAGVESMTILQQAGRLGPTVSLEDFVRGLIFLDEQQGELGLTKEQKARLLPILGRAMERRGELLAIEEKIRELESALPAQAEHAAAVLTPKQIEKMVDGRDEISIRHFENTYWTLVMAKWRLE
ncbi:MAG: hypothetical protein P9L99_18435 [Candidatus Lernaella stagnicola]|nr:hypothetical protein [Candidatus Lernaella stagnicola]